MKNKRGSITLFVLFSGLFFIMFLTTALMYGSIKRQAEAEATKKAQEIYASQNQEEIYQSYFGEGAVPIYTKEQLFKIASGENVQINEEGGKIYNFSADSMYFIQNDLEFEYDGVWQMPNVTVAGVGRIQINDTSRTDGIYHFYENSNNYEEYRTGKIGWSENIVYTIALEGERLAPVPFGFASSRVASEDEIKEGLVIYEKTGSIKKVNEENHDEALTSCNQYVWIPVDEINDMVMCKNNAEESVCRLIQEENGDLKCTTHNSKDLAGRVYTALSEYVGSTQIYKYDMDFTQTNQTYDANSGCGEPAVVTGSNGTFYDGAADNYHGFGTASAFLAQLQDDFDYMAKSVAKYGGFYIGRYEMGTNGTSKKGQTVLNNVGRESWYTMNNLLRKISTNIATQMIWGSQYDQAIKFLDEDDENEPDIGHHNRNLSSEPAVSGNNPLDEMSNIFDLEGNYLEWTAEAYGNYGRVDRGR